MPSLLEQCRCISGAARPLLLVFEFSLWRRVYCPSSMTRRVDAASLILELILRSEMPSSSEDFDPLGDRESCQHQFFLAQFTSRLGLRWKEAGRASVYRRSNKGRAGLRDLPLCFQSVRGFKALL